MIKANLWVGVDGDVLDGDVWLSRTKTPSTKKLGNIVCMKACNALCMHLLFRLHN